MSRIGKLPIPLADGVSVDIQGQSVTVRGPKGELSHTLQSEIRPVLEEGVLRVEIAEQTKRTAAMWGLYRSLLSNMVTGVKDGYTKNLEMSGVGHRASMQGSNLQLSVGFSHPVLITPPAGITLAVTENTKIAVSGIDKEAVGQLAAEIRGIKPPEPYKGKGIRYAGEEVRRKAGKTAKAGSK